MNFEFPNIDQGAFSYEDLIGQRRENAPRTKPKVVTSAYSVGPKDDLILADATAGAITVTLETAVGADGRRHTVKKIDASGNAVTVACTGGQTIDGAATQATAVRWTVFRVISDGTNWMLV